MVNPLPCAVCGYRPELEAFDVSLDAYESWEAVYEHCPDWCPVDDIPGRGWTEAEARDGAVSAWNAQVIAVRDLIESQPGFAPERGPEELRGWA